jgi:glycosyltransferase involved in cell wall biosynthesis
MTENTAPTLSLVIPVYNEAQHLQAWCEKLMARDFGVPVEYVFVDDCSKDGSYEILQRFSGDGRVRLFRHEKNQGKGVAVRRGIQETRGSVVLIQDADYEYSLDDVTTVIEPILRDEADIVFGSRYKNSQTVHRTFHYVVNRVLTLVSNMASGLYLTDMETCYKAFRGEIIRGIAIESPRFGFEPEITAKVAVLKARVAEVPIRYFPRNYLEGKKIRWTDGMAALWHIARFNADSQGARRATAQVPDKYKVKRKQWL